LIEAVGIMGDTLNGFAAGLGKQHFLTLCARHDLVRVLDALGARIADEAVKTETSTEGWIQVRQQ
jgi:hypothetical protein